MIAPALWISAVVFVISLSIVLLITSYLIWQIFQSRRRVANTNKVIFSAAMSFMIINWMLTLHLIVAAVYSLITLTRFGRNITQSAFTVFNVIAAFLFLFQNYLLLLALFIRLSNLFHSGPLRLSKCTTSLYIVALSLIPVLCVCIPIIRGLGAKRIWQRALSLILVLTDILLLVSIMAVFTSKLQQIQKNKTLNAFIRRQIILALFTVISNILFFLIVAIRFAIDGDDDSIGSQWMSFIESVFMPFHILCNFLSIALSYRCCDSLIILCCGCLRCCRVIPITTEDHDAIFLEQIMRNSKKSSPGQSQQIQHESPTTKTLSRNPTTATTPPSVALSVTLPPVPPAGGVNTVGTTAITTTAMSTISRNAQFSPNVPGFQIVYEY